MKKRMCRLLALLTAALCLTGCTKPFEADAPMSSFVFSHTGSHTGLIYTLSSEKAEDGWYADLSLLCGEMEYRLKMTDDEAQQLAALVQEHQLTAWHGFDKVDRSALDGTGFDLTILYADGRTLQASGSNAFPDGYRAAHEALVQFFGTLLERNGIENPL